MSLAVAKIREFVKLNSYFEPDLTGNDKKDTVSFHTNQMGDIYNCTPGDEDKQMAEDLKAKLLENFFHIKVEIGSFEEFTTLKVKTIK